MKKINKFNLFIAILGFGLLSATAALAGNAITVQGVMRDSAGELIADYTPTGGIKAVFYHATYCNSIVNGDAALTGCAPAGAAGSEVIDPFNIKAGAFALTLTPSASTLTDMGTSSTGWYVKIRGVFASGAPTGEFLIPLNSVPFAKSAEVAVTLPATAAAGNSVIAAINATASTDTKIDADRLNVSLTGSDITSGTIGGSTAINTTGTISSGAITSSSTVSGTGIIATASGSAATPAFRFDGDPDTGIFSSGSDTIGFSAGGTNRFSVSSSSLTSSVPYVGPVGTAAAPAFTFSGRTDTGVFSSAASTLDFSTGGTNYMSLNSSGALTLAGGSLTGGSSGLTVNAGGTNQNITLTPSGTGKTVIGSDGSTSNPTLVFTGETTLGFTRTASNTISLLSSSVNVPTFTMQGADGRSFSLYPGSNTLNVSGRIVSNHDNGFIGLASSNGATIYGYIFGEAASALGIRNGTSAQSFRVYNTYTSATDFERGNFSWTSNILNIGTEKGSGGGSARALALQTDGSTALTIDSSQRVGIGTTSPVERLEVTGNVRVGQAPSTLTTVNGAHNSSVTTITVVSTAGYPSAGTLFIGSEAMTYTGTTATTFTGLTRGALGTTAASISNGATVDTLLFVTQSTSTTPKVMITANGVLRMVAGSFTTTLTPSFGNLTLGGELRTTSVSISGNALGFGTSGSGSSADTQVTRISAGVAGIGTSGGTSAGSLRLTNLTASGDIAPASNNTSSLGSTSLRWLKIWATDIDSTNAVNVSSDRRLKKNVKDSELGLDFINSLRPVSYQWKDPKTDTVPHYGFIAQELEEIMGGKDKGIVKYNKDEDRYSVAYTELIAPVIKAVQELSTKVASLFNSHENNLQRIKKLEQENTSLKAAQTKLESEQSALRAWACSQPNKPSFCSGR